MLKKILQLAALVVLTAGVIAGAYLSTQKSLRHPTELQIDALDNVGESLSYSEQQAVILSRSSYSNCRRQCII